ncbi:hypothetical protein J4573_52940 [Actinomadura barringtoniae]|uniref:Uncharacterized protein n=1 Tax=Actinomadura barringtoniae TaxID=1427535 RepID=A0A939PW11_9ACTN|nr:hypothetical protein [Actinomadura barringtoniae]MBO2455866.1 hypothetical protein [Actinomadura barringtoniae]
MSDDPMIYQHGYYDAQERRPARLYARPAEMIALATGAFGHVWSTRKHSNTLLRVLHMNAVEEAHELLKRLDEREAWDALLVAWEKLRPAYERLMREHGFLAETVADVLEETDARVERLRGQMPTP